MPPKNAGPFQNTARLDGKTASDAFKGGNNAGMLFKKASYAAQTPQQYTKALQNLRQAEKGPNGDSLRQWGK